MKSNRRDFIRQLSMACGSVLFLPACNGYISPWRFFTEQEALTVIAFSEQIIPEDKDPGATFANVVNFIDKQLVGAYTRFQEEYRNGISAIEATAQKLFQKAFYDLEATAQIGFMEQMERGELPDEFWKKISQQRFFNMLRDHTMQGFYGSPRHGGNKNYVSYKMMKLDYPHVLGQNRYNHTGSTAKMNEL